MTPSGGRMGARQLAWDGVFFPAPPDWDLSLYETRDGVTSLVFEDPVEVKFELDWTEAGSEAERRRFLRRCKAVESGLERAGRNAERLGAGIPSWWSARRYRMEDGGTLLTALHAGRRFPILAHARFHGRREEEPQLMETARMLLDGFGFQADGAAPWRVFDIAVRVPRRFRLAATSFLAGRKMMGFECRMRRLFLWRLSLADRLLKDEPAPVVVARFLSRCKELTGVRFEADGAGGVAARRSPWHPFGHSGEIGRWCFRYHVAFTADTNRNALVLLVFHYRDGRDLDWIRDVVLVED
jgi:hypothetical protein